jgi:short-subunit dehydrogenase
MAERIQIARAEELAGKTAVVTGATGGIGRAIALALARYQMTIHIVGRRLDALNEIANEIKAAGSAAITRRVDFATDGPTVVVPHVDLLIHAVGIWYRNPTVPQSSYMRFINSSCPVILTRSLEHQLRRAHGQVVFINSSACFSDDQSIRDYAQTKRDLNEFADAFRAEVNADGVRVLSVYPGRVATPMQEAIHAEEGMPYCPEKLLQPDDVAIAVVNALMMPRSAEITDIYLRPMVKT